MQVEEFGAHVYGGWKLRLAWKVLEQLNWDNKLKNMENASAVNKLRGIMVGATEVGGLSNDLENMGLRLSLKSSTTSR